MSCYLDNLRPCRQTKAWPFEKSAHLIADHERELDDTAQRLGLFKRWKQKSNLGCYHYDLSPGKFFEAVKLGIPVLPDREFIDVVKRLTGRA